MVTMYRLEWRVWYVHVQHAYQPNHGFPLKRRYQHQQVNAAPAANNRQLPKAQLHKRGTKQLVISRYFNHEMYC
jgi:hypothetical protein